MQVPVMWAPIWPNCYREEKQDIILMDDDEEKLSALSSNFDLLTVTASPSSISGLKEVGVKEGRPFHRGDSRREPQHDSLHAGYQPGSKKNGGAH